MYSPGIVDLIDQRWDGYGYGRDDVVEMVARIARPSARKDEALSEDDRQSAEALLAACD
ncbi:hypothetical protein [Sphingopyxis sp. H093]|nr:hypothetical protein [Sphingopyxis sp. H093]